MATPPQGRKMAPERPFPILIETGKSYPKTGLFPAVFRRFSDSFASGLPAVFQRFSGKFGFASGFPGGFPNGGFASGFPAVFRRFSGFSVGFLGKFDGDSTAIFRQHASPGSTPSRLRLRPLPFIRKKLSGNSVHTFTPTNPA